MRDTLKSITREECEESLNRLINTANLNRNLNWWRDYNGETHPINGIPVRSSDYNALQTYSNLIEEYFDNPPLKFEELEAGMWVWDDMWEEYVNIESVHGKAAKNGRILLRHRTDCGHFFVTTYFDETRFYRKQVKN